MWGGGLGLGVREEKKGKKGKGIRVEDEEDNWGLCFASMGDASDS